MKIRSGFVSNSSSSSFVILGYRMDKAEYKKLTDDERDTLYDRDDVLSDDGPPIIGEVLGEIDENNYYFHPKEFDCDEIKKKISALAKKYKKKISEIKLIIGKRAC